LMPNMLQSHSLAYPRGSRLLLGARTACGLGCSCCCCCLLHCPLISVP
jgi:hypothetical protein